MDVAAGDTDALRALYTRYGAVLFGLALRQLGDRQLAEDCIQEVFVTAWRSAGRYDPRRASVSTWLFAIARNKTVDALRRRSRRPAEPLPERWPDDEAPDAAELVAADRRGPAGRLRPRRARRRTSSKRSRSPTSKG